MAGQPDRRAVALSVTGSSCQLQVALEHLRYAVHAAVAEGATARECGYRTRAVTVDTALLDETVRLAGRTEAEDFQPQPDERREPVVDLWQVDLIGPDPGVLPQPPRHLRAALEDVVQWPVQREAASRGYTAGKPRHVDRWVRQVFGTIGGGDHECGHAVNGDVAVVAADWVEKHWR